jgi:hypothetical protein
VSAVHWPKLIPAVKVQWLADLRSGKFTQAEGRLRRSVCEFCCLGVLVNGVAPGEWRHYAGETYYHFDNSGTPSYRTIDKIWQSGTRTKTGDISRVYDFLAERNDVHKWSFSQIADWIEVNL